MGRWGPGLHQSDFATELLDDLALLLRLPESADAILDRLSARHPAADDGADEDHCTFWLVLADRFHRHGIVHAPTFAKAHAILDGALDDASMAALGMSVADRRRRAADLARRREAWRSAPSRPAPRRVLSGPEAHVLTTGEIRAYPTRRGNGADPHASASALAADFHPDGWNAFLVGRTAHVFEHFATCFLIRLQVETAERPSLDVCLAAPISGVRYAFAADDAPPAHGAFWTTTKAADLRRIGAIAIGRVDVDPERIEAHVNGARLQGWSDVRSLSTLAGVSVTNIGDGTALSRTVPLGFGVRDLLARRV